MNGNFSVFRIFWQLHAFWPFHCKFHSLISQGIGSIMNQPCTVLISSDGKLSSVDIATLRADLESKDIQKKRNAVKSAIIQMSNGKDMSDLLMYVIRFCVTVDDHELSKLLHMYVNTNSGLSW